MKFIKTVNEGSTLPKALPIQLDEARQLWAYTTETRTTTQIQVIDQIANIWSDAIKNNGTVVVEDIFVEKNRMKVIDSNKRIISDASDEDIEKTPSENLAVGRMIAKVSVKGLSQDMTPTIAVLITEKDEQYGVGENTRICSNFSILSSEKLYNSKEKPKGAANDWLLKKLKDYMKHTLDLFENDVRTIEKLHKTEISEHDFHAFLGGLYQKIEFANHARLEKKIRDLSLEDKLLPITGRQLSHIAIEAKNPTHEMYNWQSKTTSLWSLINYGTEVIKFEKNLSDSLYILQANRNWVDMVQKRFASA